MYGKHHDAAELGGIVGALVKLAQLAINRMLYTDKLEAHDPEARKAKINERTMSDKEVAKAGQMLHGGIHALHSFIDKNRGPKRRMIKDFDIVAADGKEHTIKKGTVFSVLPIKSNVNSLYLEAYHPYLKFKLPKKVIDKILNKKSEALQPKAKPDEPAHSVKGGPKTEVKDGKQHGKANDPNKKEIRVKRTSNEDYKGPTLDMLDTPPHGNENPYKPYHRELKGKVGGSAPVKLRRRQAPVKRKGMKDAATVAVAVPATGDVIEFTSDRQIECGPCSFAVLAASHGQCTVNKDGKLFTFPIGQMALERRAETANGKPLWIMR